MDMFKDIEIGEYRYRISRLSAKTGTWMLSLAIKDMQGTLSEAEYANIHQHLLSVCSRFKGEHPMPILKADGSVAVKDLEYDLNAVVKLKKEAKDFNFADFFAERAREIKSAMSQDPTTDNTAE